MTSLDRVKKEVARVARRAYELRLQTGNGGNLSTRVADSDLIVIKPSGLSFEACRVDNLVVVDGAGRHVEGKGTASRELRTHLAIYKAMPAAAAVFHVHSPWAVAASAFGADMPLLTYHARAKLGRIPVLDAGGEASDEVAQKVALLLAADAGLSVFVQARHGIFSFAATLQGALYQAELVEETAKLAWLSHVTAGPMPMAAGYMPEGRTR